MANEKDFELLDDYISNRLPMDERVAFEEKLTSDPALSSEYELQNKIAESIRKARAAELKNMLNNIPVPPASGSSSMLIKIVAIILTTGLIGTGVYFYFNTDAEPAEETVPLREAATDSSTELPEEKPAIEEPSGNEAQQTVISADKQERKRTDVRRPETAKRSLNVFDPSEESEHEGTVELPEESVAQKSSSNLVVETDNTHKKYTFHYQFANGKLYLYGSFDENLYEIMEFISENKRTVFLYYKNNYYLLNDDSEKVKPLSPVNDPALLKKLREHRTNQN